VKTTGAKHATTASGGTGFQSWKDADHARVADGSLATFVLGFNEPSVPLELRGFGFQVPEQAQILGVTVRMVRSGNYDLITDASVRLVNGAPAGTDHKSTTKWTTPAPTYGGADDGWDAELTPAVVNAESFGISLSAILNQSGGYLNPSPTATVDEISIELTYCE
jgi:hypothetical protein